MSTTNGFNPIPVADVGSCLNECSDAFGQLAALLTAICRRRRQVRISPSLPPWASPSPTTWRTTPTPPASICRKVG